MHPRNHSVHSATERRLNIVLRHTAKHDTTALKNSIIFFQLLVKGFNTCHVAVNQSHSRLSFINYQRKYIARLRYSLLNCPCIVKSAVTLSLEKKQKQKNN